MLQFNYRTIFIDQIPITGFICINIRLYMGAEMIHEGRDPVLQAEDFTRCVPSDELIVTRNVTLLVEQYVRRESAAEDFALKRELYKV
jgi:hypothetical protein